MDLDARLRAQVAKATGRSVLDAPVERLKQDASNRSYFRVGAPPESWVLMVMPPDVSKKSEEVHKGAPPSELPFLNVHRYLERIGVRIPRVVHYDEPGGLMVLEDLGDLTLENALRNHSAETLYPRAIDLLARLRFEAEQHPDSSCIAFSRAFDEELYEWELHHFREYGLEIWSGRKPTGPQRERLDRIFKRISRELAAAPRGFTHRDYQSRNLMLKEDELVVIDFQDALQGPRQYDLVALLRDSYVELEASLVDRMLDRYTEGFARLGGERIDAGPFKAIFDLLTVQRKLKDAGRFEFINRVK